MNNSGKSREGQSRSSWSLRLYLSGVLVLIVGLGSALWVYLANVRQAADELTAFNGKQYDFQLERIGGRQAVLIAQLNDWFSGLWHGQQLAYTLAILAIVLALLCFWLAEGLACEDPSEAGGDGGPPLV